MVIGGIKPKTLFGSVLVEGNYGSGKTFFTEDEVHAISFGNPDYYIISNIPMEIANVHYNSKEDWDKVLDNIYTYFYYTNNELKDLNKYKNILVIMDECHLYYPARGAMNKGMGEHWLKLNTVLTQCRKRNVKFYFITQRVQKVDIEFRRLSEFIYYLNFNRFFGLPINRLSVIRAGGGISDLIGEDGTTWSSEEALKKDVIYSGIADHNTFFFRLEHKFLHKDWPLWREKHLTHFICGISPLDSEGHIDKERSNSIYTQSVDELMSGLLKTPSSTEFMLKINNHDDIPVFRYGKKYLDFKKKVYKTEYV